MVKDRVRVRVRVRVRGLMTAAVGGVRVRERVSCLSERELSCKRVLGRYYCI
jgi:hypothetical protein